MIAPYHVDTQADLSALNTMALDCRAAKLITLDNEDQIAPALTSISQASEPLFILSGGSNVLLPPRLNAHVLRPLFKGIEVLSESKTSIDIEVMAGEQWHDLVVYSVSRGWFGLENLALIPGLTGAAPVQNIGAYGVQLEDVIKYVRALHLPTQTWHHLTKSECQFAYRDSIFKQQPSKWLICRVGLTLHKDNHRLSADYGDLQDHAQRLAADHDRSQITPLDIMNAVVKIRQRKLPNPATLPNCGSFFKNPVISSSQFNELKRRFSGMVGYRIDDRFTKVAAGWLIDQAGLKGDGIAPILSHDRQALVLTNHTTSAEAKATQQQVAATQAYIQQQILDKFGIRLEREPVWVEADGSINPNTTI